MATLDEEYEKKHLQAIQRLQRQVEREYHATIETVFKSAVGLKPRETFRVAEYPALQQILDREMQRLSESLEGILVNGIESQWELSQTKFGALVDRRYGKDIPTPLKRTIFDANRPALEQFLKRKTNGLGLSERVWKYTGQFRAELEQGLYLGISEGKPAAKMASEMKQFLKEPDKLFRRVRDTKGNLRLSKAAKAYKPGQGVYRSSYKNALRLTRTETNMAYRSADMERWKRTPFILGHEVRLSNAHPRPDICDSLKGKYPKDFKFTGWHPQCICYTVPILPSAEEYDKYEDAILAGEDKGFQFSGAVQQPPKGFVNYFEQNHKTIAGYKSKPYWVKDNPDFVRIKDGKVVLPEKVQPVKVVTVKPEAYVFTPAKDLREVADRIKATGVKEVQLGSASLHQANTVLEAVEKEASFAKLDLTAFRLKGGLKTIGSSHANGLTGGAYNPDLRTIDINLDLFNYNTYKPVKTLFEEIDLRQKRITEHDKAIAIKRGMLGKSPARDKMYKKEIKTEELRKQDLEFQIKRFKNDIEAGKENMPENVGNLFKTTEEQVKNTVTHELGHHRDYDLLNASGNRLYSSYGKQASVYGGYGDEYFAEWFAKYRAFGAEDVPEDLLKLFKSIK